MDFKRSFPLSGNAPLPFFMTYPGYLQGEQDNAVLRDLEYLQQTYPAEIKRYQRRIAEMLDKLDYEGSMIYDEYPDRETIVRLTRTMMDIIQREEMAAENVMTSDDDASMAQRRVCPLPERRMDTESLIQVLLCNEIFKRRRGGRRGFLKF